MELGFKFQQCGARCDVDCYRFAFLVINGSSKKNENYEYIGQGWNLQRFLGENLLGMLVEQIIPNGLLDLKGRFGAML